MDPTACPIATTTTTIPYQSEISVQNLDREFAPARQATHLNSDQLFPARVHVIDVLSAFFILASTIRLLAKTV